MSEELATELERDRGANRDLDARVAVALYSDTGHADARDNTHARMPSKSDQCAPGTYWISAFSGLSLRTAPDYTSDRALKRLALAALATQGNTELLVVRDDKGFVTLHEPNEDGAPDDIVASIWREDYLGTFLTALRTDPDHIAAIRLAREALEPLLAQFALYRESDLNHECAHRLLVRYELWEIAAEALTHLETLLQTKGDDRGEG